MPVEMLNHLKELLSQDQPYPGHPGSLHLPVSQVIFPSTVNHFKSESFILKKPLPGFFNIE